VARVLEAGNGRNPEALIVSGAPAPHRVSRSAGRLRELQDPDEIWMRLGALGGTPAAVLEDDEMKRLFQRIVRADVALLDDYHSEADFPLRCPILAFGALDDREVDRGSLRAWRDQTTGSFRLHMMAGGHFFIASRREEFLRSLFGYLGDYEGAAAARRSAKPPLPIERR
jgi:medium-chain acyl-[acyl-carrier-protein] hydrolase